MIAFELEAAEEWTAVWNVCLAELPIESSHPRCEDEVLKTHSFRETHDVFSDEVLS